MDIKKWAKNRTVRAIGWAIVVLLCLAFWLFVIFSGMPAVKFKFNPLGLISIIKWAGLVCLVGICIGLKRELTVTYRWKDISIPNILIFPLKYFSEHSTEVIMSALIAGFVGMFITLVQRWIFKLPHGLTEKLWLSNSIIAAIFYFWGRSSKKAEEERDRDS